MTHAQRFSLTVAFFASLAACAGSDNPKPDATKAARVVIGPSTTLLTASDAQAQLTATAFDAEGHILNARTVTFSSARPSDVTVDSSGVAHARVEAGSALVTATVDGVTSAPALVAVAALADGVSAFGDAAIASGPTLVDGHFEVMLTGGVVPGHGDLIVGTGDKPLAGRVLSVNGTTVTYESAPITALFRAAKIDLDYDATATADMLALDDTPNGLGVLGCEGDFSLTGASTVFELSIQPHVDVSVALDVVNSTVQHLRVLTHGSVDTTGKVTVELGANAVGSASCTARVGVIVIPITGPMSVFLAPIVPVYVVGEVGAKASVAALGVGVQFAQNTTLDLGVDYTPATGFVSSKSATTDGTFTRTLNVPSQANGRVDATLFAGLRAILAVGNILTSLDIARVDAGGELETKVGEQYDVANDDIFKAGYELKAKVGVSPGSEAQDWLASFGFGEEHLDLSAKVEKVLAQNAQGSQLDVDKGTFSSGDALKFTVLLTPETTTFVGGAYNVAEVRIYALDDAASSATLVASAPASAGQTKFVLPWNATFAGSAQAGGKAKFYGFVVDSGLTTLTSVLPFELGPVISSDFAISPRSVTLAPGATQQFTVTRQGETTSAGFTYTVTGGSIDAGGLYTAGTTAGTFSIIATDDATAATAKADVKISALVVTPESATVAFGATRQFTATYAGAPLTNAVWTASGGTVSDTGLFTAGTTRGVFNVVVSSTDHAGESVSVVVTVTAPCTKVGSESYCIEIIPEFYPGQETRPCGLTIDDSGVVTGRMAFTTDETNTTHVFRYAAGSLSDLSTGMQNYIVDNVQDSASNGLSGGEHGLIYPQDATYILPAIYSASGMSVLALPAGDFTGGYLMGIGLTDAIGIVQNSDDLARRIAIWRSGVPHLVEPTNRATSPADMNDAGDALYVSYQGVVSTTYIVLADDTIEALPVGPDVKHITNNRLIADSSGGTSVRVYDYTTGSSTYYPPAYPYGSVRAESMNEAGTVVGGLGNAGSSAGIPAVSHDGLMTPLATLIAPESGWVFLEVWDINNAGEIVACGNYQAPGAQFLVSAGAILRPVTN